MSNELVVLNNNDNDLIATGGLGLDDSAAIRPTPMVLKQPTTTGLDSVLPGLFVDKLSGVTFKEVKMVPIKMTVVRDKYPSEKYVAGEFATCRSFDGIKPITNRDDLVPEAPNCKGCRHSSWDNYNAKTKTGKKPTCKESFSILFIEETLALPFYIKISGLSVRAAKRLKEAITRNAKIVQARSGKMPNIFDYVVTMKSVKSSDGAFYNIEFPEVAPMTPEKAQAFGPMYLELVRRKDQIEQEIDSGFDESGDVASEI